MIQQLTEELYAAAPRKAPDDAKTMLAVAREASQPIMLALLSTSRSRAPIAAETNDKLVCFDGRPTSNWRKARKDDVPLSWVGWPNVAPRRS